MESPPVYQPQVHFNFPNSSNQNGGRDYISTASSDDETTPLVPDSKEGRSSLSYPSIGRALCILFFVIVVTASGLGGAWIQESLSTPTDILDPKVRDRIRYEWKLELKEHEQVVAQAQAEEHEWQEKKEQRERQEQEWGRMRLYWDDIQPDDKCISHGTRKYSARLMNLLPGIDAVQACKATPITIRNVAYDSPLYCEDRTGTFGGSTIYGHWKIDEDPICSTYWTSFRNKGCLAPGSGLRRVESWLMGLRSGDDGQEMCFSTPAFLYGQNLEGPTGCEYHLFMGYLGVWNVPDESCMSTPGQGSPGTLTLI